MDAQRSDLKVGLRSKRHPIPIRRERGTSPCVIAGGRVLSVSSVLFVEKESRPRMTPISRIERQGEKI